MMITTNRLHIRLLRADDDRALARLAEDFSRSPYWMYDMPSPTDPEKIRKLTKMFAESEQFYAVFLPDEPEMIGYICFYHNGDCYDMGYRFHSAFHGHGYAHEACIAAMEHMRSVHPIKAFTAGTALKNEPSCRLLHKLGFMLESTEELAFHKAADGSDITFTGGNFIKPL